MTKQRPCLAEAVKCLLEAPVDEILARTTWRVKVGSLVVVAAAAAAVEGFSGVATETERVITTATAAEVSQECL